MANFNASDNNQPSWPYLRCTGNVGMCVSLHIHSNSSITSTFQCTYIDLHAHADLKSKSIEQYHSQGINILRYQRRFHIPDLIKPVPFSKWSFLSGTIKSKLRRMNFRHYLTKSHQTSKNQMYMQSELKQTLDQQSILRFFVSRCQVGRVAVCLHMWCFEHKANLGEMPNDSRNDVYKVRYCWGDRKLGS